MPVPFTAKSGRMRLYWTVPVSRAGPPAGPCCTVKSPPSMLATRRPWSTEMVRLTGKLAVPTSATRLTAFRPMNARATGTPISRVIQRPGVMVRRAGARGGPVTGPVTVVMAYPRSSGAQVVQHGEDATVVAVAGRQPELGKDVVDVLFHRAAADDERPGDGGVGPALGHQREHLPLARGQRVERVAAAGEQLRDDFGIERAAAG